MKVSLVANPLEAEWRDGQHDDLVLAVPLPAWLGEQCLPEGPVGLPHVLGGPGGWP